MANEQTEREDKYDVEASFQLPDLSDLLPAGGRLERDERELRNVYYDTADGHLRRQRVTLRRRYGGPDEGWHLKLPAESGARTEVQLPPDDARTPPVELRNLTVGLRRGRPLRVVATLTTHRSAHRLLDADGVLAAEVADDSVSAAAPAGGSTAALLHWREVEVELGPAGTEDFLVAIGTKLRDAGAVVSRHASKLARTLEAQESQGRPPSRASSDGSSDGQEPAASEGAAPGAQEEGASADAPPVPTAVAAAPSGAAPDKRRDGQLETALDVVLAYLEVQRTAILAGDLALRRGEDAIHPTRVATRRFRSTVRTFGPLFDADRAAALDAELRWYAGVLGRVRDVEVLRERMAAAVNDVPDIARLGPVAADINSHLLSDSATGAAALARALSGRRYLALLDELDAWLSEPPITSRAHEPVETVVQLVDKAARKVARRLTTALAEDDDEALHGARKAGKRARYAAELAAPVLGAKKSARRVQRFTDLQDALGEFQDSVVAADLLLRLGRAAGTRPGENGFGYGVLYAEERQRGREARARAAKMIKQLH